MARHVGYADRGLEAVEDGAQPLVGSQQLRLRLAMVEIGAQDDGRDAERLGFLRRPLPLPHAIVEPEEAPESIIEEDRYRDEREDALRLEKGALGRGEIANRPGDDLAARQKLSPAADAGVFVRNRLKVRVVALRVDSGGAPFTALTGAQPPVFVGRVLEEVGAARAGGFAEPTQRVGDGCVERPRAADAVRHERDGLENLEVRMPCPWLQPLFGQAESLPMLWTAPTP